MRYVEQGINKDLVDFIRFLITVFSLNILLTNDDGINALGIKKVESILKQYGNVYVVAPKHEQSGKGCSVCRMV